MMSRCKHPWSQGYDTLQQSPTCAGLGIYQTADQLAEDFATTTIALGIFVLLVYFTGAALYCLCCMEFKEDTLLFSRLKTA
jgi:hypothetical protein